MCARPGSLAVALWQRASCLSASPTSASASDCSAPRRLRSAARFFSASCASSCGRQGGGAGSPQRSPPPPCHQTHTLPGRTLRRRHEPGNASQGAAHLLHGLHLPVRLAVLVPHGAQLALEARPDALHGGVPLPQQRVQLGRALLAGGQHRLVVRRHRGLCLGDAAGQRRLQLLQ
jgi:hypothetical protein